jgi:hypothetical protein
MSLKHADEQKQRLGALFDRGKRAEMQRALAKGEAVPSAKSRTLKQPPLFEDPCVPVLLRHASKPIQKFMWSIMQSSAPAKARLELVKQHVQRKVAMVDSRYSEDEFNDAMVSLNKKLEGAEKFGESEYSPLEQEIVDLQALDVVATTLERSVKAEEGDTGL